MISDKNDVMHNVSATAIEKAIKAKIASIKATNKDLEKKIEDIGGNVKKAEYMTTMFAIETNKKSIDSLTALHKAFKADKGSVYYCENDKDYIPYVLVSMPYDSYEPYYSEESNKWILKKTTVFYPTYKGFIDCAEFPERCETWESRIQREILAIKNEALDICEAKNRQIEKTMSEVNKPKEKFKMSTFIEKGTKKADYTTIVENCVADCKANGGKVKDSRANMSVYIKPEDSKAYWVLGDKSGSVDISFE